MHAIESMQCAPLRIFGDAMIYGAPDRAQPESKGFFRRLHMQFIALEIENPNVLAEAFQPHLSDEARRVWELQQQGIIREAHFRADRHTAVLVLECESLAQAQEVASSFPLVQQGLIRFELIPLVPYSGLARLFA